MLIFPSFFPVPSHLSGGGGFIYIRQPKSVLRGEQLLVLLLFGGIQPMLSQSPGINLWAKLTPADQGGQRARGGGSSGKEAWFQCHHPLNGMEGHTKGQGREGNLYIGRLAVAKARNNVSTLELKARVTKKPQTYTLTTIVSRFCKEANTQIERFSCRNTEGDGKSQVKKEHNPAMQMLRIECSATRQCPEPVIMDATRVRDGGGAFACRAEGRRAAHAGTTSQTWRERQ